MERHLTKEGEEILNRRGASKARKVIYGDRAYTSRDASCLDYDPRDNGLVHTVSTQMVPTRTAFSRTRVEDAEVDEVIE